MHKHYNQLLRVDQLTFHVRANKVHEPKQSRGKKFSVNKKNRTMDAA